MAAWCWKSEDRPCAAAGLPGGGVTTRVYHLQSCSWAILNLTYHVVPVISVPTLLCITTSAFMNVPWTLWIQDFSCWLKCWNVGAIWTAHMFQILTGILLRIAWNTFFSHVITAVWLSFQTCIGIIWDLDLKINKLIYLFQHRKEKHVLGGAKKVFIFPMVISNNWKYFNNKNVICF